MTAHAFHKNYVRSVLEMGGHYTGKDRLKLPGGRTLVLSPHYDDEVIGAGGTIMTQLSRGHRVSVIYLTDGREGIPKLEDRVEVERIRRGESERARRILGVSEQAHLSAPETRLRPTGPVLRKLTQMLKSFAPELIFIPWFFDNHVDHVEANMILYRIEKELDEDIFILGYEVWTPLSPNLYVDVTRYASKKREALHCFSSQLEQVDYLRTSMALSRRRALEAAIRGYAEAFLCLHAREYFDLIKRSGIASMRFIM